MRMSRFVTENPSHGIWSATVQQGHTPMVGVRRPAVAPQG